MVLTPEYIASTLDHSTLQPFLMPKDIVEGCKLALAYQTASVCARPCDVPILADMLKGSPVKVCTVIGFPHGAHNSKVKFYEAEQALKEGCQELDMVINIGHLLAGEYAYVQKEIESIARLAHNHQGILKVILENCYLSDEEKVKACQLSEAAGADFVKTSTGYGTSGATIADLILMRKSVSDKVFVKASGGIRDLDTVLSALAVGATRCGVSATKAIMEEAVKRHKEGTLKPITHIKPMGEGY